MLSKKILLPTLVVAVLGAGVAFTTAQAHAETSSGPLSGLVQAIAQKFGLDSSQVQSVVSDYKTQQQQKRQQTMQQREQDRLDRLVQQSKITATQKQAILDEQAKLQSEYPVSSFKNLTADQRKQQFQKMQAEIKSWASSQNLDPKYLLPAFRFGRLRAMQKTWTTSPTPTQSS